MIEYIVAMTKMLEAHYNLTEDAMERLNCPLEDCFPYSMSKKIEINGKTYRATLNITFEEI